MHTLNFSHNWNNKLANMAFTTLRLSNAKYEKGSKWAVRFKGQYRPKLAQILEKKQIKLAEINEYIARLDTGYSKAECQQVLRTMYKNSAVNWDTQKIDFILLAYTDESVSQHPELFK